MHPLCQSVMVVYQKHVLVAFVNAINCDDCELSSTMIAELVALLHAVSYNICWLSSDMIAAVVAWRGLS